MKRPALLRAISYLSTVGVVVLFLLAIFFPADGYWLKFALAAFLLLFVAAGTGSAAETAEKRLEASVSAHDVIDER